LMYNLQQMLEILQLSSCASTKRSIVRIQEYVAEAEMKHAFAQISRFVLFAATHI
jgi:hypothetical protein